MRKKTLWLLGISLLFLILVTVLGIVWEDAAQQVDFARKNLPPGTGGLFGTDWMGRDMLKRTVAGLSLSIRLGLLTAAISAAVALALALLASLGGGLMDSLVCGLINLVMGIPHMLLLILISYSLGKGFRGVAAGIALTHWASLARLLRAEILQIRDSPYMRISEKLGKKPWFAYRFIPAGAYLLQNIGNGGGYTAIHLAAALLQLLQQLVFLFAVGFYNCHHTVASPLRGYTIRTGAVPCPRSAFRSPACAASCTPYSQSGGRKSA